MSAPTPSNSGGGCRRASRPAVVGGQQADAARQRFLQNARPASKSIQQTAQAVAEFAATAREWKAASVRIFATSAARDAVNAADLSFRDSNTLPDSRQRSFRRTGGRLGVQGSDHGRRTGATALLILDVGGAARNSFSATASTRISATAFRSALFACWKKCRTAIRPPPKNSPGVVIG